LELKLHVFIKDNLVLIRNNPTKRNLIFFCLAFVFLDPFFSHWSFPHAACRRPTAPPSIHAAAVRCGRPLARVATVINAGSRPLACGAAVLSMRRAAGDRGWRGGGSSQAAVPLLSLAGEGPQNKNDDSNEND
jgi:hypothetical protein